MQAVTREKGGLHRMQFALRRQPLDRRDCLALAASREREAGKDTRAVDLHRARPARTAVAALLCAAQTQLLAQRVEQCRAWLNAQRVAPAVYLERDIGHFRGAHRRCARLRDRRMRRLRRRGGKAAGGRRGADKAPPAHFELVQGCSPAAGNAVLLLQHRSLQRVARERRALAGGRVRNHGM